jgi:putative transcriptional regulator
MKTTKKRKAVSAKTNAAGREIIAALQEAHAGLESGEPLATRFNVRKVIVAEPGQYKARDIINLRNKLRMSQAVFAKIVGASASLVQSWEYGRREPDVMARRLLDEITRDPQRWAKMIREAPQAA